MAVSSIAHNKTIDDYCPVCGGNGLDPASYGLVETGLDGVVMLRPKAVVWPTACSMCNQSLFPRSGLFWGEKSVDMGYFLGSDLHSLAIVGCGKIRGL